MNCQFPLRKEARQTVGVLQFPSADKAVVAGVALEVHAEKDLCCILRGLHGRSLARADIAAPVDTDKITGRVLHAFGIQQCRYELVVGKILFERATQPFRDGLASARIFDAFVIAQQIVPEPDPMARVILAAG